MSPSPDAPRPVPSFPESGSSAPASFSTPVLPQSPKPPTLPPPRPPFFPRLPAPRARGRVLRPRGGPAAGGAASPGAPDSRGRGPRAQDGPCLRAGDGPGRRPSLVPAFVLRPERSHARLTMEVEDSGGVVLTAYHSYARSQQPSSEPRCAPRAASHPGSRYPDAPARAGESRAGAPLAAVPSPGRANPHLSIAVPGFGGQDEGVPVLCVVLAWKWEVPEVSPGSGQRSWPAEAGCGAMFLMNTPVPHFCQIQPLKYWRIKKYMYLK